MNVVNYPAAYRSAFRPALFTLGGVSAADGLDVSIMPATGAVALGVKRIYGNGEIAVNVAPYVRGLLSPSPLCDRPMGMFSGEGRVAGCRVSADGATSAVAWLTAGTDDAPVGAILSGAPETVKIRPGEKDELSVISADGAVKPFIVFSHEGTEYTVDTLASVPGTGMHTFVVDAKAVAELFAAKTGASPLEMTGFAVMPRVSAPEGDVFLSRRYETDCAPHSGRRLMWVNRYGAVDCYTFPVVSARKVSGAKARISTADGVRAVSASAGESLTLVSEHETAETLSWLAEVLSSPRVWIVGDGGFAPVDVEDSSAEFDPSSPGSLTVKIAPAAPVVSRKF